MIEIIKPDQFKTIPWKNGKGFTQELAINENGTIEDFDWRLSMADVTEDGPFSNFENYVRHLILIQGNGITLNHDRTEDHLNHILEISRFDGANNTIGKLHNGPIKDFNIMVKKNIFTCDVQTYTSETTVQLKESDLIFIYSLSQPIHVNTVQPNKAIMIKSGQLCKIVDHSETVYKITGKLMILIYLSKVI